MELDINSTWVDFFSYAPTLAGGLTVSKLLPDMRPSTNNYLTASSRDFIAAFSNGTICASGSRVITNPPT